MEQLSVSKRLTRALSVEKYAVLIRFAQSVPDAHGFQKPVVTLCIALGMCSRIE